MATIFIVDDSVTMRQMINFTLSGAGHEVVEAANVDEALKLALARKIDLVISDVNMPGRSGIELVRALRALPAFKQTPILMLTTESQPEMRDAGRAAGATGWIVKPFNPEGLKEMVQKVLA